MAQVLQSSKRLEERKPEEQVAVESQHAVKTRVVQVFVKPVQLVLRLAMRTPASWLKGRQKHVHDLRPLLPAKHQATLTGRISCERVCYKHARSPMPYLPKGSRNVTLATALET